jgi:IS5 family transposase
VVGAGVSGASALREGGQRTATCGLSIMLQMYFVQQWFNLSDPGVEEALYESAALRRFVGVDLGVAPAPDETTICRFRHLLEKHALGGLMLEAVNVHLEARGIRIATGTHAGSVRLSMAGRYALPLGEAVHDDFSEVMR